MKQDNCASLSAANKNKEIKLLEGGEGEEGGKEEEEGGEGEGVDFSLKSNSPTPEGGEQSSLLRTIPPMRTHTEIYIRHSCLTFQGIPKGVMKANAPRPPPSKKKSKGKKQWKKTIEDLCEEFSEHSVFL